MTYRSDMANNAAEMVAVMLTQLQRETGIPFECILAGAHAQIVTMMTTTIGGPMAAHCCEAAASRVRNMPSLSAARLALCRTEGSA